MPPLVMQPHVHELSGTTHIKFPRLSETLVLGFAYPCQTVAVASATTILRKRTAYATALLLHRCTATCPHDVLNYLFVAGNNDVLRGVFETAFAQANNTNTTSASMKPTQTNHARNTTIASRKK
jgi:hypothetical protein